MIKRIIKRVAPILMALVIMLSTVFTNLQVAHATGVEPILYYTYWDLISSLYATCGYTTTVDENVVNNHGVTGKQVWDNFCTWVDLHVKAHNELVLEPAVKELKNLVNTATDKGVSLSQDLYDLLKECFAEQVEYESAANCFDTSSVDTVYNELIAWTGASSDFQDVDKLKKIARYVVEDGLVLNILIDSAGRYLIFCGSSIYYLSGLNVDKRVCYLDSDGNEQFLGAYQVWVQPYNKSCYDYTGSVYGQYWVIRNGQFVANDTVGAQVSAGACPKEVPDVSPWIKNPAIPDEWRIVRPGETPNPDEDPDDNPDVLPFVIPIHPPTIDPDPDPDPDPKPDGKDDKEKDTETDIVPPIPHPDTDIDPVPPPDNTEDNTEDDDDIDPDPVPAITSKYGDITKLFPFCIPFDLVKLIKGLSAKKAPPVFHFEYKFKAIHYNFVVDVDLSDYEKYVKIFRYGMQIFYIIALMFMTARLSELFS